MKLRKDGAPSGRSWFKCGPPAKKTVIMGSGRSKALTGTRLGRRSLRAPKEVCDRAHAGIHNLERGLVAERERETYCQKLRALIMHIKRICPNDSAGLENRLSALLQE